MKIAVYAIAKNEAKHVERFMASVREADEVVVLDTGSTDDTYDRLYDRGAYVYHAGPALEPFRFDAARNSALSCVRDDIDICVSMDLDEVALPGWRQAIERAWRDNVTRLRYLFVWSHHADGSNDISFYADKVHKRHGYHWEYPVHEFLTPDDPAKEKFGYCDMQVHHWPDASKSRGSYLPLLELSAKERPNDHRAALYYGRELMYYGRHRESVDELLRYLSLPSATWSIERSSAMRFIARGLEYLGYNDLAELQFIQSAAESPNDREPWVELANLYWDLERPEAAFVAIHNALKIKERPNHYCTEAFAWGQWPQELADKCFAKMRE